MMKTHPTGCAGQWIWSKTKIRTEDEGLDQWEGMVGNVAFPNKGLRFHLLNRFGDISMR